MADDKKKAPVGVGGSGLFHKDHHKEVLYYVLPGLFILAAILERLFAWWDSLNFYTGSSFLEQLLLWLASWWPSWQWVATLLSAASVGVGVYAFYRVRQISKEEEKIFGHGNGNLFLEGDGASTKLGEERWQKILNHAHSENPAEWRLAIIEADVLLDETLRAQGYQGEGLGEMLKSVEPTDLLTLDAAWEAHKIRNRIAHDGQGFDLTDRETRRVISLFEVALKELGAI